MQLFPTLCADARFAGHFSASTASLEWLGVGFCLGWPSLLPMTPERQYILYVMRGERQLRKYLLDKRKQDAG